MIVVLDCNIWVSLTINNQIDFIADLFDDGVTIATCTTLRNEITHVLHRPKLSKFIPIDSISKVIALHDLVSTVFDALEIIEVVSDPKDNYLFALSLKSKADFLVTGDQLLLEVNDYGATKVVSLNEFRNIVL